jgi:hypothetical protein
MVLREVCREFGGVDERPVTSRSLGAEAVSQGQDRRVARADGPSQAKASRFLWGIDWAERLPRRFTEDGIELCLSDIESTPRAEPLVFGEPAPHRSGVSASRRVHPIA